MENPAARLRIGRISGGTWDLIRRRPMALLAGAAVMSVIDTAFEIVTPDSNNNLISSVVSIAVVYLVMRTLLREEGLVDREGGFGSYFGASLLAGIGAIVGLVFLIVPGLYLMARWSLAPTMVLSQGYRATDALRESWRVTQPFAWKLVLVWFLYYLAFVLLILLVAAPTGYLAMQGAIAEEGTLSAPVTFLLSLLVNLGLIAAAYISVVVFRQIFTATSELEDVFA